MAKSQLYLFFKMGYNRVGRVRKPTALGLVAVTMFYVNSSRLDYMPMPEKNSLGYAYWMMVAGVILYTLSYLCTLAAAIFKTLRMGIQKDPRYSEEMMLGK